MTLKPAWDEVALGIGTILLALIVGWQTTVIPSGAIYAQVGPTVIPWMVTGLLGVLGALLTLNGLRGLSFAGSDQGAIDRPGLLWLLAGLFLNAALIDVVGFILASTTLFVCTARAFASRKPVRDALIGFVLAVVAYVGFDRVLGYRIGSGLIERLL